MDLRPFKAGLRRYLEQYQLDHTHPMTRLTHVIGIPLIVAALPTLPRRPKLAAGMLAAGWALQFLGHYGFEKKNPSFFGDPLYLLVGPIWVALEVMQWLGLPIPADLQPAPPAAESPLN